MAELAQQERLQPALLDRLTDDAPDKSRESRERRALNMRQLRASVLRDLAWLLNTDNLAASQSLEEFPLVASSVLNFGIPDLAGLTSSSVDVGELERSLQQAISDFEPRILADSLSVTVSVADEQMDHNAMTLEIDGELWAKPLPLHLFLKTEVDLESGAIRVVESSGG